MSKKIRLIFFKSSRVYPRLKEKSPKPQISGISTTLHLTENRPKKACISLPYMQSNNKINIPSAYSKICSWFPYLGEEGVMVMWGILRLWGREALLPFCWNESEETNWWRSAWTSLGWTGILWNTKKRFYHWTLICDNVSHLWAIILLLWKDFLFFLATDLPSSPSESDESEPNWLLLNVIFLWMAPLMLMLGLI